MKGRRGGGGAMGGEGDPPNGKLCSKGLCKAVRTKSGQWPLQNSCCLRGVRGLASVTSGASQSMGRFGGPRTRPCIHKVVHTQGRARTRWSVATTGVLLFMEGARAGPRIKRSEP